jgi:hypothetical protein
LQRFLAFRCIVACGLTSCAATVNLTQNGSIQIEGLLKVRLDYVDGTRLETPKGRLGTKLNSRVFSIE